MSNEPGLPRGFLQECLLLLLHERPGHGYDLVERLRPFGFDGSDPGGAYRALRGMEAQHLVHSAWQESGAGPHRRVYELTQGGRDTLAHGIDDLSHTHEILFNFLARYHRITNERARGVGSVGT